MMQMNASLWPQLAANSAENNAGADPWGVTAVMETQARLWNHFLDANRSFWAFYSPWLQAGPSLWGSALVPLDAQAAEETEAKTADGIPDALELQTRSWNHFLDANRSFWTALNWPVPATPWVDVASNDAPRSEARPASAARRAAPRKTARKTAR